MMGPKMDKKTQFNVWYFLAALLGLFLLQALFTQMADVEVLTYSRFKELAKERQVENIVVTEHKHRAMMGNAAFPSKFDARITMLEDQLAGLKAGRDAAVALYGKLDSGQKTKADILLPMSLCS